MADTPQPKNAIMASLADNTARAITARRLRDALESLYVRTSVSVKEFGAIGDGFADDTLAFQSAFAATTGTLFIPAGNYRISAPVGLAGVNSVRIVGEGHTNTNIIGHHNGDVLAFTDCSFMAVENISVQHAVGFTGSGMVFYNYSTSNTVERCLFANNSVNGLGYRGTAEMPQSSNRTINCLFLANQSDQLFCFHNNDYWIESCAFGNATTPYSPTGCRQIFSSAGYYAANQHWGNVNGLLMEDCLYNRLCDNRFEESRNQGVHSVRCHHVMFSDNLLHTNSMSTSGAYAALELSACSWWNITGNHTLSWNTDVYKHRHSILANNTCSYLNIVNNLCRDNALNNIQLGGATNCQLVNNWPSA